MSKHTPTPWKLFQYENYSDGFSIYAGDFGCTAERWEHNQPKERIEQLKANGEFIVRAVNSHDELLESLQWCIRVAIPSGPMLSYDTLRKGLTRCLDAIEAAERKE